MPCLNCEQLQLSAKSKHLNVFKRNFYAINHNMDLKKMVVSSNNDV